MSDELTPEDTPIEEPADEEIVEEPAEAPAEEQVVEAAEPEDAELYKVTIDGEEQEVTKDELIRNYQLRQASDKRFQEASEQRKEAEAILQMIKDNPKKALSDPSIGVDLRQFAEDILAEALEEELLDPKEKEIRDLQRKLEAIEAEKAAKAEEAKKAEMSALEAKLVEDYKKELDETLEASGLPNSPRVVERMIHYRQQALDNDMEIGFKDVVGWVKEDLKADVEAVLGAADVTALAEILGEEGLKRIREFDVSRLKKPKDKAPTPERQPISNTEKARGAKKFKSWKDLLDDINKNG